MEGVFSNILVKVGEVLLKTKLNIIDLELGEHHVYLNFISNILYQKYNFKNTIRVSERRLG